MEGTLTKSLYKVLGVLPTATTEAIKKAYRKLAQKWHPDKEGGDMERFKEIQKAYSILADPEKRKRYEETGSTDESKEPDAKKQAEVYIVNNMIVIINNFGETSVSHMDVMELFRKKLRKDVYQATSAQKKLTRKINVMEKANKRFKGSGANIMHVALNSQIGAANKAIKGIEEGLTMFEIVKTLIKNIDYEFTPDNEIDSRSTAVPWNVTTGYRTTF